MFSSKRGGGVRKGDIPCIFVHAGAGYHSVQNEQNHLAACNDAAKAAMAILRGGGSAVDAVEIAVKVLEDREITNAGYGSNLAMDGVVECDAVVVDHFGRSGGAGAVAQIKNPVSLARLLLDHTTQTLSLRRVPPNLLVGQGATDFAYEHSMSVLPLDFLVSPAARERWQRWKSDLIKAENNRRRQEAERHGFSPSSEYDLPAVEPPDHEQLRRTHTDAMMAGVWNEAQPISPPPSDDLIQGDTSSPPLSYKSYGSSSLSMPDFSHTSDTTPDVAEEYTDPYGPPGMLHDSCKNPFANSTQQGLNLLYTHQTGHQLDTDGGLILQPQYGSHMDLTGFGEPEDSKGAYADAGPHILGWHDGSSGSDSDSTTIPFNGRSRTSSSSHTRQQDLEAAIHSPLPDTPPEQRIESPTPQTSTPLSHVHSAPPLPPLPLPLQDGAQIDEDQITDTVGAIAVDNYGNIACAASSGGIGMKHRGRIGPAALVGIGAAVIPTDLEDHERQTVATVTSGTGEHMATTQAASACSERLHHNLRKVAGGGFEEAGDDEAIKGFIEKDFMGHPSVKQSHSTGAIGILSVKKTKDGAYLYFAHNTDSFALASMHAEETRPVCTMSRNKGNGSVAQGGRAIRYKRKKVA